MDKKNIGIDGEIGYVLTEEVWADWMDTYDPVPKGFTTDIEVAKEWVTRSPANTYEVVPIFKSKEKQL